jgi:hypothetical protein
MPIKNLTNLRRIFFIACHSGGTLRVCQRNDQSAYHRTAGTQRNITVQGANFYAPPHRA